MRRSEKRRIVDVKICVIGLGYVGIVLADSLADHFEIIGYDINPNRVDELNSGLDSSGELLGDRISTICNRVVITDKEEMISGSDCYIIAVPTPVDHLNIPDLRMLEAASEMVGRHISRGNIVIFESTVWPGCTEEVCIPLIEASSRLLGGIDFKYGYSPERVNPGDRLHTLKSVTKVVSANDRESAQTIADIYSRICDTLKVVSSIRVAEAAKIIENTQRDVNIALMNEFAVIFQRLGISTREVLEAARTKWNFLPFEPGLVGGHCIGVDPYYLAHKASEVGYDAKLILSGRLINEGMVGLVYKNSLELIMRKRKDLTPRFKEYRVLLLGITFKENIPDTRNSKHLDLMRLFVEQGIEVELFDPVASAGSVAGCHVHRDLSKLSGRFDCVIFCVRHDFIMSNIDVFISRFVTSSTALIDLKGMVPAGTADYSLI